MTVDQSEELLSVAEAAKALRVSVPTIKRWIKDGRLPAYHLGPRYVRIRRADLTRLLTPLQRGEVTSMNERDLSSIKADLKVKPLTDEQVSQALQAMKQAQELRSQMRARRGGKPLSPSWEILREVREERAECYE